LNKEKIALLLNDNKIILLDNISEESNRFEVNSEEFYKYIDKIKALVHTHEKDCKPSLIDIIYMSLWNFPWIIVSKNCIKAYQHSSLSIFEIDINSLIPQELHYLLMQFL